MTTTLEPEHTPRLGSDVGEWLLPDALLENLQLIADGVIAVAGFAVAAIRIRRGDELELVIDTGRPEEVGSRIPLQLMLDELETADDWGILRFVPFERGAAGTDGAGWVVPDVTVTDLPDAWHPMDMLVAPLYDDQGELRGTLAIDEPLDGRRPDPERRRVLEKFAALASRAVLASVEREAFAKQIELSTTARNIVRTTSAQLSLDGLLRASVRTLVENFHAQGVWIDTFSEDGRSERIYSLDGRDIDMPSEIVSFAERSARLCWEQQRWDIVGAGYPVPELMSLRQFEDIVALLDSISVASLVFVPLGAGQECLGLMALARDEGQRDWTAVECAALMDIGHDLGRAALNARMFDREHMLVAELRALDTYKDQLIATVSHELKSPLTAVAGHLEMLDSGTVQISADARDSLAAIGRASERMSRVIENLLTLRQVQDPDFTVGREPVDLNGLVLDVVELTRVSAQGKGIVVQVEAPPEPVLALGERDELDKVVLNLVSNAVKYTPPGRGVAVQVQDRDGNAVLSVCDEGIGISEADQARLFTEFFRSTNPEAVAQPGTGLGLVIVQRIVQRHGGTITVESEPGRGSTFTVCLPGAASAAD